MVTQIRRLAIAVGVSSLIVSCFTNVYQVPLLARASFIETQPIVDVKPTNTVSELSTLCSSTEQFGLLVSHDVVTNDEVVELTNYEFNVNNGSERCHARKSTQGYFLEGYFDVQTAEGIFSLGVGKLQSIWTVFDEQLYSTPLGVFTKDVTDFTTYLNYVDEILNNAGNYFDGAMSRSDTGTYYTVDTELLSQLPTSISSSVVEPKATKTTVFIPDDLTDDSYKVRYAIYYADNDYGVSVEYYDFEVQLNVKFEEEIPVDDNYITTSLEVYESLYNYVTR